MKKIFSLSIFFAVQTILLHAQNTFPSTGSAGIGTTTPNASSLLEMVSTTKGLLIPRMTKTQRDAIASPVTGLMIYQTNNTPGFYYYDGSTWAAMSKKGWSLTGNSGTNPSTNFIGTTDQQPLVFKVNNSKSGIIDYNISLANTAFGYQTLNSNTASYNTAFGYQALMNNNSGYSNTSMGYQSLLTNTIGYSNVASGTYALYSNLDGNSNVATGYAALYNNISGFNNVASGYAAMYSTTNGFSNIALGRYTLFYGTSPVHQIAIGDSALMHFTGAGLSYSGNVAIGSQAMTATTTGDLNVAIGWHALSSNTNANDNVAIGYASMVASNSFANTAAGMQSLTNNTTGSDNTGIGFDALYSNTTGNRNTTVGEQSLMSNTTGSNNSALGYNTDVNSSSYSNTTVIGYSAIGTASNQIKLGNASVTSIGGYANWTNFSDGRYKKNIKENIPGLSFINKLRPVSYTLDVHGIQKFFDPSDKHFQNLTSDAATKAKEEDEKSISDKEKVVYTGFIAQEVEKSAKELNYDFSGVDAPKNGKDLYGLRYGDFVVPLVKAVQQLSKANDDKDAKINDLQKQIDELKAMITSGNQTSTAVANLHQQSVGLTSVSLEQNIPNPFNSATAIHYTLPQMYSSAQIVITDKNGKVLKQVNLPAGRQGLSGNGKGILNVEAQTLSSGVYNYTLYVDGKMIGSKQMILTK